VTLTLDHDLIDRPRRRLRSRMRAPLGKGAAAARYSELVRRASLLAERLLGRGGAVAGRGGTGAPPGEERAAR
jgi:hypothetical protein